MSLVRVAAGSRAHKLLRGGAITLGLLAAVAVPFNSSPALNGDLTLALAYAVAAAGLGLLVGYGGRVSLGHGAVSYTHLTLPTNREV